MEPHIISEDLGPRVAAFTCRAHGRPAVVINTQAAHQPVLRMQAAVAMLCCGIDAAHTLGALSGVRS